VNKITHIIQLKYLSKMKILFCSPIPLIETLGTARTILALAYEFKNLGWEVKVISPEDIVPNYQFLDNSAEELRTYLLEHTAEYDVIEYDHSCLPYPRIEFSKNTLFVARSQLLERHLETIQIPLEKTWKSIIHSLIKGQAEQKRKHQIIERSQRTISESDIMIVLNHADKDLLMKNNIAPEKVYVIPNGLSLAQMQLFNNVSSQPPIKPKVAFVGTFDARKGSTDFPAILQNIFSQIPDVNFRLLGTSRSVDRVLAFFPKQLRHRIEVYPHFAPDDLPTLLTSCSVGIFPSYLEGFGLAVLEMLAASIPVIAYDSPGPPMMLPPEYLVPPGDVRGMSAKVVALLQDGAKLASARVWAKERSQEFCWPQIAQETSQIYLERLAILRSNESINHEKSDKID
jgi:glycosyltransferase involved in cell wall biosynthesis